MIKSFQGLSAEVSNTSATDITALEQKNMGLILGTGFGYRLPMNFSQVVSSDRDINPVYLRWEQLRSTGSKYIAEMKSAISAGATTPPDYGYIDSIITEALQMRDTVLLYLKAKYDITGADKGQTGNYTPKPETVNAQSSVGSATPSVAVPAETVASLIPNIPEGVKKAVPYALGGLMIYNMITSPLIPLLALGGVYLFNANKDKIQPPTSGTGV